ncbi:MULTISPECIES: helix-turn-helix transcriptional regulator [Chryseobacterium]|uniref:Helix-turn-helix transcriptional regulator n=1 Tax=Chryseobacterium endophyticum TaxID=1854762 RepID=A0AAU6WMT5_9FLAO
MGKAFGTSGDIIGRYERDEVKPSIEVAIKIADVLIRDFKAKQAYS